MLQRAVHTETKRPVSASAAYIDIYLAPSKFHNRARWWSVYNVPLSYTSVAVEPRQSVVEV